ncbi:VCBS repeat-containing protein [Pricia sp. S334]|uniref:VCBS repeat-containing protein n=1 Tax=Pricia mediterranea TaxID=3076079 RepID=A0ABU3L505_9FLAO|nr:VCBS repeat-containing protein [Pricia sp. S334]MDT7828831.1 VCBS repeat-containing protein [Pricia sp. S334]
MGDGELTWRKCDFLKTPPILFYLVTGVLLLSCNQIKETNNPETSPPISSLSGRELANVHCASCHIFVPPDRLSKEIWKLDVLPAMGNRLGIYNGEHQPDSIFGSFRNAAIVKEANVFPEEPLVAREDWDKLVAFYVQNAPEMAPSPKPNTPIKTGLKHFKYNEASYANSPPLTAMVKILSGQKGLVFGDGKPNGKGLTFLNPDLEKGINLQLANTPIHYHQDTEAIYLTTIGKDVYPNDLADGALLKFKGEGMAIDRGSGERLIANLQRPVDMAYGDLNNDGLQDVVACEYGDLTGKLVWYENMGNGNYTSKVLKIGPGAIKAIINDYNKDGQNDIFVLMAQGDEGILYFENVGNGKFVERRLLRFSPLNGSQYFELADFNGDGLDDILYVCGDNADKTPILKEYHGIYIFINAGNLNFEPSYFYHQNGAYKALSRDYDGDGDLDIAAISFFPDYADTPEESFVYLENRGGLEFVASTFAESTKGRWVVMDAGDIDGDGDIDLALGSSVQFFAKGDTTGLSKKWLTESPSVILLENTLQ